MSTLESRNDYASVKQFAALQGFRLSESENGMKFTLVDPKDEEKILIKGTLDEIADWLTRKVQGA